MAWSLRSAAPVASPRPRRETLPSHTPTRAMSLGRLTAEPERKIQLPSVNVDVKGIQILLTDLFLFWKIIVIFIKKCYFCHYVMGLLFIVNELLNK